MRKLLIGATHSDVGKTTITLGIMRALRQRGYVVQPFKVGPDYIDTGWHQSAAGLPSRNLDAFMLSESALGYLFAQSASSADVCVIEGVMGLYDGLGIDSDCCSSASLAKRLGSPVVLVVDGKSVSTSLAAMVQGFVNFDPQVEIVAVIINRVNSEGHYQLLKRAIERYCAVPVIGRMPMLPELELPSRHLGLVPNEPTQHRNDYWQRLAELVEQHIDLACLLSLINDECVEAPRYDFSGYASLKGLTIAVAKDEAFHFYYQDNLDLLSSLGARLIEFSPLRDARLPNCQAVYIGGGFPELYAQRLSANVSMREDLLAAHQSKIPIYAECGGLMYLGQRLITAEQEDYPMVGILQGYSEMTKGLQRFGYSQAKANKDTLIARKGGVLRGHEFHYSRFVSELPTCFEMSKIRDDELIAQWQGGFQIGNTFAGYLHLHFYQSPEIINGWLGSAKRD